MNGGMFERDWLLVSGGVAMVLAFVLTAIVRWVAIRIGVVDQPGDSRKIHRKAIPLLGGFGIYCAITIVVLALLESGVLTSGEIGMSQYVGFLLGGLVLMIGGFLDDKYTLPPLAAFIAPLLAATIAIAFGIEVE